MIDKKKLTKILHNLDIYMIYRINNRNSKYKFCKGEELGDPKYKLLF